MRRSNISLLAGLMVLAGAAFAHPAAAGAWLGVYSQDITSELREGMNYNGSGALVTRVVDGSPAEQAGIERGDVIVRVGPHDIDSPEELVDVVGSMSEGSPVDVVVVREGGKKSLRVTLESRPDADDEIVTPAPRARMRMRAPQAPDAPEAPEAPGAPRVRVERHRLNVDDGDLGDGLMMQLPEMLGAGAMGRGRLGVRIESLNPDLASYFGPRDTKGALVLDVTDGSPADKAGIRAGDVITKCDGKVVENAEDLIGAVRSGEGSVSVSLLRHGTKQTVEADLGAAPRAMRFEAGKPGLQWQRKSPGTWEWKGKDGKATKRIIIRNGDEQDLDEDLPGDGMHKRIIIDGDGPMLRREMSADREGMESLREEMQNLRDQLEQLRKELKSNR